MRNDGLVRGKWSEEDLRFLKDNYPTRKGKWCAEQLNRPFHATHKMAAKLGLKAEWKHTSITSQGYVVDTSDRSNRILKHRKVMEEHLGRKLSSEEIIHHINGVKTDNRIENLEITNRSDHPKMHMKDIQGARKSNKI